MPLNAAAEGYTSTASWGLLKVAEPSGDGDSESAPKRAKVDTSEKDKQAGGEDGKNGAVAEEKTTVDGNLAGAPSQLVGIDCEMCYTAAGLVLTRATLVGETGDVLLDALVKPEAPITDYNTQFSGITEDLMTNGPTCSLVEVKNNA